MAEIRIPKVGMSTVDVEIIELLVSVGSVVTPESIVMSVAADKVDLEVEAKVSGTITEILFAVGDVVEVGHVVALVDEA